MGANENVVVHINTPTFIRVSRSVFVGKPESRSGKDIYYLIAIIFSANVQFDKDRFNPLVTKGVLRPFDNLTLDAIDIDFDVVGK